MAYRISPDFRLSDYPQEVSRLWRSRDDEPTQEVFERFPMWMNPPYEDRDTRIDLERLFPAILETLTMREQKLLWCRFWADYTLDETGMVFGVTKERIRQIEAKAIRKLKHPTRSDALRIFVDFHAIKIQREKEEHKLEKEYQEKQMLKRHIQYMENRLIEKLLKLRENT